MAQRALTGVKAWEAQRAKSPRLPDPSVVGISDEGETRSRRRRRRRRMSTAAVDAEAGPQNGSATDGAEDGEAAGDGKETAAADGAQASESPSRKRRRRRRRRKVAVAAGEGGETPEPRASGDDSNGGLPGIE